MRSPWISKSQSPFPHYNFRSPNEARGVRFDRKLKLSRYQIEEALARKGAGESLVDIGRSYGVSHSTISRLEA
jgi:hypothetical protein